MIIMSRIPAGHPRSLLRNPEDLSSETILTVSRRITLVRHQLKVTQLERRRGIMIGLVTIIYHMICPKSLRLIMKRNFKTASIVWQDILHCEETLIVKHWFEYLTDWVVLV